MKKFWFGGGDDILTATLLSCVCFFLNFVRIIYGGSSYWGEGGGGSDLLGALIKTEVI